MIKQAFRTGLLVAATAASLSVIGGTGASAQGIGLYLGGVGVSTGYWGDYDGPRWRHRPHGFIRYDRCPAYYVRERGVCYPTW